MFNNEIETVSRITQLDAIALDDEILRLLKHQVLLATKFLKVGFLGYCEPEVDAVLRFLLWRYSVNESYGTFGQQLLSLKFGGPLNKTKAYVLALFSIGPKWVQGRSVDLAKSFGYGENASKVLNILHWLEIIVKAASVINLILFIRQGRYPTLANRVLCMKPCSVASSSRRIGYSYMSRELLWNGFMELLVFTLPLINYRFLRRKAINLFSWRRKPSQGQIIPEISSSTKCAVCGEASVLPHHMGCSHVFCYYCLKANVCADNEYECPLCGTSASCHGVTPLFF